HQQNQTTEKTITGAAVGSSSSSPHKRPLPPLGHNRTEAPSKSRPILRINDYQPRNKFPAPGDEWDRKLSKDLVSLITSWDEPYLAYVRLWRIKKAIEKRKSSTYDEEKVHFFHFVTKINNEMERKIATKIGLPAEGSNHRKMVVSQLVLDDPSIHLGTSITVQQPIPKAGAAQIASVSVDKANLAPAQASSKPSPGIVNALPTAAVSLTAIAQKLEAATGGLVKQEVTQAPTGNGRVVGPEFSAAPLGLNAVSVKSDSIVQPTETIPKSVTASVGRSKRDVDNSNPQPENRPFVPRVMDSEFTLPPPDPNAPQVISDSNARPMGESASRLMKDVGDTNSQRENRGFVPRIMSSEFTLPPPNPNASPVISESNPRPMDAYWCLYKSSKKV
uniref:Uncharacterized protein n=1 Tax=Romanomermis culicivorax TaxID=13658 RepID=A0A915JEV1_ROMCU